MQRLVVASILMLAVRPVLAQVDTVNTIVNATDATGAASGNSLAAFGYDGNDTIYTTTFAASGTLRRITGINSTPSAAQVLSTTQYQLFYRSGDPSRTVSTPSASGIIFNPVATPGGIGAFGAAWISDLANTNLPTGSSTKDPAETKRLYRYNLGNPPVGGDGRDIFTTMTTLAAQQTAASTTATTDNFGRQATFSPDGKWIYANDSSTGFGGIYRINPDTGATTRIVTSNSGTAINTEPAVVKNGTQDRIFFRGNTAGGNIGGVNYVDHDPTTNTTSAQQALLTAADLQAFLETASATDVSSIGSDAAGNLYIHDSTSKVVIRYDTLGRMSKVVTRTERDQALTTDGVGGTLPTGNFLRQQFRTITHPTAGSVTQLMYAETTPLNQVAGVTVFKPGDFNRDGSANAADLALLASKITLRGVVSPVADSRFDMNGNLTIDYKERQAGAAVHRLQGWRCHLGHAGELQRSACACRQLQRHGQDLDDGRLHRR
ncbi:MAG: hypothetical protein QM770_04585 [Tepidisphaeraceae bacterium]